MSKFVGYGDGGGLERAENKALGHGEHEVEGHTETPVFWYVTSIAILLVVILIGVFSWFLYVGHEPLEPVHDQNPHASLHERMQTNPIDTI